MSLMSCALVPTKLAPAGAQLNAVVRKVAGLTGISGAVINPDNNLVPVGFAYSVNMGVFCQSEARGRLGDECGRG
jgi:hypothetical protein